jgi:hypothetical protein
MVVFQWFEVFGFCQLGQSGPFVEAGHTRLGGRRPVNTDGGVDVDARTTGTDEEESVLSLPNVSWSQQWYAGTPASHASFG